MDLTLDISEVQILVNYPADPGGFFWHHRILLHRIEGANWLCLTPDHDVVRHDLNNIPHRVLSQRAPFPDDIAVEVYAHDAVGKSQLVAFKRQAKLQAVMLGEGEPDESEASEWLIADAVVRLAWRTFHCQFCLDSTSAEKLADGRGGGVNLVIGMEKS